MAEDTRQGPTTGPQGVVKTTTRPTAQAQRPASGSAVVVPRGPQFPPPEFKGQAVTSIIHPDVRHEILAAGFYGSGKTRFGLGVDLSENVLMLDFEMKGESDAKMIGLENYFCPPREASEVLQFETKPVDWFARTRQIIEAMPTDRFTVLMIDGASFFQAGIAEKVRQAPQNYGVDPMKAQSGRFGGIYPGVKYIMNSMFAIARAKGVKVIVMTAEVGQKWGQDGPIFNKFEVKGVDLIHKMSVLSLLMVPGYAEYYGAPSGIVLKEALGLSKWEDGRFVTQKRIPPKLPRATMADVYQYLKTPANYARLKPQEIPTKEELDPFLPIVSKDQLASLRDLLAVARLTAGGEEGPAI